MKHRLHTEQKCRTQNGSGKHETVTQQMAIASAGRGEDLFPELSHYNKLFKMPVSTNNYETHMDHTLKGK